MQIQNGETIQKWGLYSLSSVFLEKEGALGGTRSLGKYQTQNDILTARNLKVRAEVGIMPKKRNYPQTQPCSADPTLSPLNGLSMSVNTLQVFEIGTIFIISNSQISSLRTRQV